MNPDFAQGLPATSIPPSPTERSGLGAEPTPSRSPRTRRAAHVSPKSPPPSPTLRGILQASSSPELCTTGCDPRAASTLALDRPGPRGGAAGTRPARSQGCPSLTPSLGRRVRAHNIRPASRLRRPSGVKLSAAAHAHRPATGLRQGAPSPPPPPARSFPASDWPDRRTAEPRLRSRSCSPNRVGTQCPNREPRAAYPDSCPYLEARPRYPLRTSEGLSCQSLCYLLSPRPFRPDSCPRSPPLGWHLWWGRGVLSGRCSQGRGLIRLQLGPISQPKGQAAL